MQEGMNRFIQERIAWYQQEQKRLRWESRTDEATHMQIAANVYSIFLSTCQAMKNDLAAATARFSSIAGVWEENHHRATEHNDFDRQFVEDIKLRAAKEILDHAKEVLSHD